MSKNLRTCLKTMELYSKTKSKNLKKSLLHEMSKTECFYKALYEVVNNIYLGNLNFPNKTQKQLKKFIPIMQKIHSQPKTKRKRMKMIKQTGGFISFILPILSSVLAGLVGNAVS